MPDDPSLLAKQAFQQALLDVSRLAADASADEIAATAQRLREALLRFGSSSDDNLWCVQSVVVGLVETESPTARKLIGLRLADRREVSLAELLWSAEGSPIPAAVQDAFAGVTQTQWNAALRMATLLCLAFEGSPSENDRD